MHLKTILRAGACFLAGTLLVSGLSLGRANADRPSAVVQQHQVFQEQAIEQVKRDERIQLSSEAARMIALRAFLRGTVLAETALGGQPIEDPYRVMFRYRRFESFDRHPDVCVPFEDHSDCSTAAGAYQFLSNTWAEIRQQYPDAWDETLPEFAPQNQDRGAIILLVRRGSYLPLMDGVSILNQRVQVDRAAFNRAVFNACGEWASFPCAPGEGYGDSNGYYDRPEYGNQNARSIDWMWQRFQAELAAEQRVLGDGGTAIAAAPAPSYGLPESLQGIAREGDMIAGWVVTSDYGWRNINVPGASSFHRGVDLASPDPQRPTKGRAMKAIGLPDTWVRVRCWWDAAGGGRVASLVPESLQVAGQPRLSFDYLHLQSCVVPDGQEARVKAGTTIATVGDTGVGAAHAHIGQRVGSELINPQVGYLEWAFTGVPPIAPPKLPADAWANKVVSYFLEIALGSETGETSNQIRKWQGEVSIEVLGRPTRRDREAIAAVIAEINQLTQGGVVLKQVRSGGNLKIWFESPDRFAQILPTYEPPNQGYFWVTWNEQNAITGATVLIDATGGVTQAERSHLIREELTQSLGLMNDSWRFRESIFYQGWTDVQQYGWIDKALIMALYDRRIEPGMNASRVVSAMVGK